MLAPTSKQAHRIGLTVQFSYIHCLSRWWHIYESMWKYAEMTWQCYMHTDTPFSNEGCCCKLLFLQIHRSTLYHIAGHRTTLFELTVQKVL